MPFWGCQNAAPAEPLQCIRACRSWQLGRTAARAGFPYRDLPLLRAEGVPLVVGLLSFNYGGHTLFPSLHAAMKAPQHYPRVLDLTFAGVMALYALTAALGYLTFGDAVECAKLACFVCSCQLHRLRPHACFLQVPAPGMEVAAGWPIYADGMLFALLCRENVTLSMERRDPWAVPSRVAMWITILAPFTKVCNKQGVAAVMRACMLMLQPACKEQGLLKGLRVSA